MAFFLGGDFGGSTISSTVPDSQQTYDPVYQDEVNAEFIWQILPSAYRVLMDDREVFTHSWEAMIRATSGLLLDSWQTAASYSLRDIPVHQQRKWLRYDLIQSINFTGDPELTVTGITDRLTWDEVNFRLGGKWVNRRGYDKSTVVLNGDTTEEGSLRWSVTAAFSSIEEWSGAFFGYFNSNNKRSIANALAVGAVADSVGTLYPVAIHYSASGVVTSSLGSYELEVDAEYSFEAEYEAKNGILSLAVYELEADRVTGTEGTCDSTETSDIYTAGFTDESKDFDDEGVVAGDLLVIEEDEYEIESVAGESLVVATASLPAGSTGISYAIRGRVQRSSMTLDIYSQAGDPTFTVNEFGTASIDLRYTSDGTGEYLWGSASPGEVTRRKTLEGYTDNWSYFDPTVPLQLLSAPLLQDAVTDPGVYLYEGIDFEIVDSAFQFKEPPAVAMWAEYSTYDEDVLYNNFGANVGLDNETSSATYRSKIRGLYYAYYQGPTPSSIKTGVQILLGLPISEAAGTVDSINEAYSGTYGQITVDSVGYLYPLEVGTSLTVGDEVAAYVPLCDGVEIKDYISHPEWFFTFDMYEIEKYHTFAVFLNIDAFNLEDLSSAASFVETIKPTWKKALFVVHKDLDDEIDIDDEVSLIIALNLYDTPCEEPPLIAYDDAIYEAEEADWKFDQGVTDWDETSAAMRASAKSYTSSHLQAVYSPEYSGSDGAHDSGLSIFTDTVTGFADVEETNVIDIGGTRYDIISVDSDEQLTLDTTWGSMATGVSWEVPDDATRPYLTGTATFSASTGVVGTGSAWTAEVGSGAVSNTYVALALYTAGSDGVTTSGSTTFTDTVTGFADVEEGDTITLGGVDVYEVLSVDSGTEITLDGTPAADATGVSWANVGQLSSWGQVASVTNDSSLVLSTSFSGSAGVYKISLLDVDYREAFHDQFMEQCPEEAVTLVTDLAAGYQETLLTGSVTLSDGSTTVTGEVGVSAFTSEIGGPGAVSDKFVISSAGVWYLVSSVTDDENLELSVDPAVDLTTTARLADEVLTGLLTFTDGSDQVTCASSQTGIVGGGDWIQAVPGSEPVVEVGSIDGGGTTITLSSSYSGNSGAFRAIRRGGSVVLPLTVALPSGDQDFTDWYGTAGGTLSDTVAEPV
jgi:hypothetical protein